MIRHRRNGGFQVAILRVLHDADDDEGVGRADSVGVIRPPLADGILAGKEPARHRFVDQRGLGTFAAIAWPERPAAYDLQADGREVVLGDELLVRGHPLARSWRVAFDAEAADLGGTHHRAVHRQAGRLHARERPHAIEQARVEHLPLLVRVPETSHVDPRAQQVLPIESDLGGRQHAQAPHEQAGDDEQEQAERHLRRDERAAGEKRPAADQSDRA